MIDLKNITLICVDGVEPTLGVKALRYSMQKINFAKSIIISHIKPENLSDDIEFIEIEKLTHETYSPFFLKNLSNYFDTEYCLTIHDDGFVINPHLWSDEFFNYDYIGAPWKPGYGNFRVGNGGFSLRSKKLVELCKDIHLSPKEHEDGAICIRNRSNLETSGCVFAPVEVAMKFSLECRIPECDFDLNNSFGFHGRGDPKNTHDHDGFYHQFHDRLKLLESVE